MHYYIFLTCVCTLAQSAHSLSGWYPLLSFLLIAGLGKHLQHREEERTDRLTLTL